MGDRAQTYERENRCESGGWRPSSVALCAVGRVGTRPAQAAEPTIEVRLQSVNDLLDKAEYVAGLAGKEDVIQGVKLILKNLQAEGKGIEGIDPKRPFGLYATLTEGRRSRAPLTVMVPIVDQDAVPRDAQGAARHHPREGRRGHAQDRSARRRQEPGPQRGLPALRQRLPVRGAIRGRPRPEGVDRARRPSSRRTTARSPRSSFASTASRPR